MWLRQAAIASKKSGIKGIRPPKTFRGSRTERARGYCEKKTADREEEEVEAQGQEEAIVKEVRDPVCPTSEERERHYKTHVPFRSWCPVCVEAKGIEDPHHCAQHGREHEILLVAIDYKSFGQSGENQHYKGTALIVKDRDTKTIHGHIVNEKGVGDGWIVSKLREDIDNLGYTALIWKGDGEPALVQVMNEVKRQRSHKTILEHPLAYDPMSNGAVEKAVDQFMCQFRAIKTGLERRLGQKVETHWPVLTWGCRTCGHDAEQVSTGA